MFRLGKELEVGQYCLRQKSMKAIDVFQQLLRSDIFENESLIKVRNIWKAFAAIYLIMDKLNNL